MKMRVGHGECFSVYKRRDSYCFPKRLRTGVRIRVRKSFQSLLKSAKIGKDMLKWN
jgi:hypothetical protein